MQRTMISLLALASALTITGCSDLKLSNNRVREDRAGQTGYDVTHQVTERQEEHQSGATGVAVSEVNSGDAGTDKKPNPQAGAVTAVENTATQELTGTKDNSRNGVKQEKH